MSAIDPKQTLAARICRDAQCSPHPPQPPAEPEMIHVADDRLGSPNYFDDNYNPKFYHDKFWGKTGK